MNEEYENCVRVGMKRAIAELERNNNILMNAARDQELRHQKNIGDKDAEIARLKLLTTRAADALAKESWPSLHHDYSKLIAELRKAAG